LRGACGVFRASAASFEHRAERGVAERIVDWVIHIFGYRLLD
jgi:hypothetical protein